MNISTQVINDIVRIKLEGKFSFEDHKIFREAYKKHLEGGCRTLEIDFDKVDYLDSSALGMLLLVREAAGNAGKSVELINCKGVVKQILDIANFQRLFTVR